MKVIKWIDDHLEETLLVILLVTICFVMMAQIILRKLPVDNLIWAEEFCRYCYIWSVFLSLGYTIKKGNMLRVNVVMDLLPHKLHNAVKLFTDVVMLVLFVIFFLHAIEYTLFLKGVEQISPAMQIPMWLMYCATIAGFGLAVIRMIQVIVYGVRHFNDKAETTLEAVLKEAKEEAAVVLGEDNAVLDTLQGGEA
ncbi:MAG: TRAP transporter small permease [Bacillota bacterium]|nr:TRAP transporter small permease [Bacillota bacterium]